MIDHYKILGVQHFASDIEIKRGFRAMAKRWHPDCNPGENSAEMFNKVNEAYSVLSDNMSRLKYDYELRSYLFNLKNNCPKQSATNSPSEKKGGKGSSEKLASYRKKIFAVLDEIFYEEEHKTSDGYIKRKLKILLNSKRIQEMETRLRGPINKVIELIYEYKD